MIGNSSKHYPDKHPTSTKKTTTLPKGKKRRKQEKNRWVSHRKTSLGEPLPPAGRNQ